MKSRKNLVYAFAVLIVPLLIYGCGGDDDDSGSGGNTDTPLTGTETENINGIPVPPEPDPTQNNATALGVDVNNNYIRDDVERVIAREFGNNSVQHVEVKNIAVIESNVIHYPTDENKKEYMKVITCSDLERSKLKIIRQSLLNNKDRLRKYKESLAGIYGGEEVCD